MNKEIVLALCDWHDNLIAVRHMRSGPDHPNVVRAKELILLARSGSALEDIAIERRRQINVEGWTQAHDDEHNKGELSRAASAYAMDAGERERTLSRTPPWGDGPPSATWPWDAKWWKPGDARRQLVKAGALIVAEIERLDRADAYSGVRAELCNDGDIGSTAARK